jgi:hypothetical protein
MTTKHTPKQHDPNICTDPRCESSGGPCRECSCYGRGQCAACTLDRMWGGERRPDTEVMRSLRAVGGVK